MDIGVVCWCMTYLLLLTPETCHKLANDKKGNVELIKNKNINGKVIFPLAPSHSKGNDLLLLFCTRAFAKSFFFAGAHPGGRDGRSYRQVGQTHNARLASLKSCIENSHLIKPVCVRFWVCKLVSCKASFLTYRQ
jgi:hypothetical protein